MMSELRLVRISVTAPLSAWRSFVDLVARACPSIDARPYRPEDYYMRGPGPKWREKHALDRNSFSRNA